MNPWTLVGTMIGWLLVVLICVVVVAALYAIVVASVRTIRQAHTPPPTPSEPGTTEILSGGGSDD